MSSSRLRKLVAAMLGDIRSGSAKMASKPIATTPSSASRVTGSATIVRGHSHWPISLMLASSMSTTTTEPQHRLAWLQRLVEIEGPQPDLLERRQGGRSTIRSGTSASKSKM